MNETPTLPKKSISGLLSLIILVMLSACTHRPMVANNNSDLSANTRNDFGIGVEQSLKNHSDKLFGVGSVLDKPAPRSSSNYRRPGQPADQQLLLASGLKVEYLTREAADQTDMMALWPDDNNPSHLITCVEKSRSSIDESGRLNPSIQRIDLRSGQVVTMVRGLSRCDGIRRTPWHTILVGEEVIDGAAWEIFEPLKVTEQLIHDRADKLVSDPLHIAKRPELGIKAWEGLAVYPNGVVVSVDETRPGAIYRFVPRQFWQGQALQSLDQSPLASGSLYAMLLDCVGTTPHSNTLKNAGCQVGNGYWLVVDAESARHSARNEGATPMYRAEDMHLDPAYTGAGVRFCWTNTGNPKTRHFAEVMCAVDHHPDAYLQALDTTSNKTRLVTETNQVASVTVKRFIQGDPIFHSFDNLEFQQGSGNLYVIEDRANGSIYACLPDGEDRDLRSDGCIRIASVIDSSAKPTGFLFNAAGTTAYLSLQHSKDKHMPLVDGFRSDDILKITGFKP
ncbi:MAG TPA: DUF839 domain-containing protein [Gammaproteobacteria bacterium]|nr:DUF839 domain-containing protein [Gammaproteobacteria bacterium]